MKRVLGILSVVLLVTVVFSGTSQAVTLTPDNPWSLRSLDHGQYTVWSIAWDPGDVNLIKDAVLTFENIWDYTQEDDDQLYIHLLPGNLLPQPAANSVINYWDAGAGGDAFDGQGFLIDIWTDPVGGYPRGVDLEYRFSDIPGLLDTFVNYASAGYFGIGIDADCHYFNEGVKLDVVVPEPASLMLMLGGLSGVAFIRKRKV